MRPIRRLLRPIYQQGLPHQPHRHEQLRVLPVRQRRRVHRQLERERQGQVAVFRHLPRLRHQQLGAGVFLRLHGPDPRLGVRVRMAVWWIGPVGGLGGARVSKGCYEEREESVELVSLTSDPFHGSIAFFVAPRPDSMNE